MNGTSRGKTEVEVYVRDRAMLAGYLRLAGESGRGLAGRAGLSQATVNHLVNGRRRTCSARTAQRIEAALGCPPGLLFAEGRDPAGRAPRAEQVRGTARRNRPPPS
ncbi:MAG: helix-turn-helix domain-containing protein [Jatrophihabitans sp.]